MDHDASAMSAEEGAFLAGFQASAHSLLATFEFMDDMASSNLEIPEEPPQEFWDMMEKTCGIPLPQTPPNLAESRPKPIFPPGCPQPVTPEELLNGSWTPTPPVSSQVECLRVDSTRVPITPPEAFLQARLWQKEIISFSPGDIVPQTPPMVDDDDLDEVMAMVPSTPPGLPAPYTPLMTPPTTPPGTPPRSAAGTPPGTPPKTPPPSPVSEGKLDHESTQSTESTAASPCSPCSNDAKGGEKRNASPSQGCGIAKLRRLERFEML